jgi:hypothetical protein
MLFPRRPQGGEVAIVQTVRDIVEVVAIVLAGCWAMYVFVYENRIRPANAPPEITIAGQLVREGHRNGFEIVDVRTQMKNVGTVPVEYLGFAETLRGSAFLSRAPRARGHSDEMEWTPFYSFGRPTTIYQRAFVTSAGNAAEEHGIYLGAGQEYDANTIVYVPVAYNHIVLYASGAYARETNAVIPTTMILAPDGLPKFEVPGVDVPSYSSPIAEADVSTN